MLPTQGGGEQSAGEPVRRQLERILASRHFIHSPRLSRFLRFIVEQKLDDPEASLKEYVIGVRVFDRPAATYSPANDPIVRVQARQLRARLRAYYCEEGACDPVLIDVVQGGYSPFIRRLGGEAAPSAEPPPNPDIFSLAVLPFISISPEEEKDCFTQGLTEELTFLLSKVDCIRLAARTSTLAANGRPRDIRRVGVSLGVDHVLEGSVRRAGGRLRVVARLIRVADGFHIWSERYDHALADSFYVQEEISEAIRGQILGWLQRSGREVGEP